MSVPNKSQVIFKENKVIIVDENSDIIIIDNDPINVISLVIMIETDTDAEYIPITSLNQEHLDHIVESLLSVNDIDTRSKIFELLMSDNFRSSFIRCMSTILSEKNKSDRPQLIKDEKPIQENTDFQDILIKTQNNLVDIFNNEIDKVKVLAVKVKLNLSVTEYGWIYNSENYELVKNKSTHWLYAALNKENKLIKENSILSNFDSLLEALTYITLHE